MLLYIYCDIFSFFKPNHINEITEDLMGSFQINQISLVVAGIMMTIPVLIISANLFNKMAKRNIELKNKMEYGPTAHNRTICALLHSVANYQNVMCNYT
jgi:H+/gluconate symporter-like permease